MTSLPDAVVTIQAHPAPIVFLDTCVLLDIIRAPLIRAPFRNTASAVQAATELLTGARHIPSTVYPVIGCPTPREWSDKVHEPFAECRQAVESVNAVSEAWGFLGSTGLPRLPASAMNLPDRLKTLSEELRDAAILLDKDVDALSRAIDRVINAELPAKAGGKGAKDAVIMEHALGLTLALRAAGFQRTCIFVSSNTGDFAAPKTTNVHPILAPFFTSANLRYAASLAEAVALLKGQGWAP